MTATKTTLMAPPVADPVDRAVDIVRNYLLDAGLPESVFIDIDVLGLPTLCRPPRERYDRPTYHIRLYAGVVLLGPFFDAGTDSGPCGHCLERRWLAIRPPEERRAIDEGTDVFLNGVAPQLTPSALAMIHQMVLRNTAVEPHATRSGAAEIYEMDLTEGILASHLLIADSECAVCRRPRADTAEGATLSLRPRPKTSPHSYRIKSAEQLDLPTAGYVNPVCGVLGGRFLPAYHVSATSPVSGFFRVRSKYDYHEMWWSGQAQSYSSSTRLGLLEGLERYAGQFPRATATGVYDTYQNLSPNALDPTECGMYSPEFYRHHSGFYEPFSSDRPTHWVWGHSIRDDRPVLVPEQLAFYLDRRPDKKFVQECSNGCASGSCVEEAVLHGMLEIMERDAFLLCWYGGAALTQIDVSSCSDPRIHLMVDRVDRIGYHMMLFDIRVDLPIPVVMAVAERHDGGLGAFCFAAGAGFDPETAILSAMAETASFVPGLDERVQASMPELLEMAADYDNVKNLNHHPLLYGLPEMADKARSLIESSTVRTMDEIYGDWNRCRPANEDLTDDVRYLVDRFAEVGSDVIVIRQTSPEQKHAGIETVCVIAPGLVPIDFGWQRQRVLHHPRLQAFLDDRLATVQPSGSGFRATGLNKIPHPFP